MQTIPDDIFRYQLLPFLNDVSVVKITQATQALFHTLRHKFQRTKRVTSRYYIKQSYPHSKHVGLCTSVVVTCKRELVIMLRHIIKHDNFSKLCPLLNLRIMFDEPLDNIVCPSTVHTITFDCFNKSLVGMTLPANLHTLTFGYFFDQSLDQITLPPNLHTLTFGENFDQSLDQVTLPETLRTLTFGWHFNQSLAEVTLPAALQTLTFGGHFNQSLDQVTLPPSLHTLTFGCFFNQSLDQVTLPLSLHTLTFGIAFNQSLAHTLLTSKHLTICKRGRALACSLVPKEMTIHYI